MLQMVRLVVTSEFHRGACSRRDKSLSHHSCGHVALARAPCRVGDSCCSVVMMGSASPLFSAFEPSNNMTGVVVWFRVGACEIHCETCVW